MNLSDRLFADFPEVRYVASYVRGELSLSQRPGLEGASDSETDRYEELLVNPTLLKLIEQRGNIDCGGLNYVLICYGNFYQFVKAVPGGHISVAINHEAHISELLPRLEESVRDLAMRPETSG